MPKYFHWTDASLASLSQYPSKSLKQLAEELGCHYATVRARLVKIGKPIAKQGRRMPKQEEAAPIA